MHNDRSTLVRWQTTQCCDKLQMLPWWFTGVAIFVIECLLAAPAPTLVESHVEKNPPRPSARLLIAADLAPVSPGTLKRPLREVLSRMDVADKQEGLSNEAISFRAKESVELIAVTLLAAHRHLVSTLHPLTPTRPGKGCIEVPRGPDLSVDLKVCGASTTHQTFSEQGQESHRWNPYFTLATASDA